MRGATPGRGRPHLPRECPRAYQKTVEAGLIPGISVISNGKTCVEFTITFAAIR